MKIKKIWFDERCLYGEDESGNVFRQSLLWYRALWNADDEQRKNYRIGFEGIHWPDLNEDVSFESFTYKDAMPTPFQEFFLTHNEINISGFSEYAGINPTLFRNYINGFKRPSAARLQQIQKALKSLAQSYYDVNFTV